MSNGAIVNGGVSRGALGTVRSRLPAAALALAVALLAFAALGSPARAATFTVTNTNDSGEGSLRDVIGRANADPATADVIEFVSSVLGQITLTSGPLRVSTNLTINGPGADALTVSGNDASGVFAVNTADAVNISNLTIADASQGSAILHMHARTTDTNDRTLTISDSVIRNTNAPGAEGGGLYSEGGRLVLQNTTVSDNIAARGGGIYIKDSSLAMRGSTVRNNQATFSDVSVAESLGGGGVYLDLSLSPSQTATVEDSVIADNTATRNGGGIYAVSYPSLTITRSTIERNRSLSVANRNEGGGGLHLWATNTVVRNSTISSNEAAARGAGINALSSVVTVANSTISGNQIPGFGALGGGGGGIHNHARFDGTSYLGRSDLTVLNSTVTDNMSFGVVNEGASTAAIGNTIVASDHTASDVRSTPDANGPGAFTSRGYNLIGSADGGTSFTNGQNGDKVGTNSAPVRPKLGPLADNGGPTRTHALLSGSPALDAGKNLATDAGDNPVTTDQRGRTRPADFPSVANASGGDASDIGAYEAQAQPATNLTVNTLSGEDGGVCTEKHCSLREAIGAANSSLDRSTIGFSVTGTIPLAGPLPGITTPVEITGPGARRLTVDGGGTHRVFSIEGGDSTISDLKIAGGRVEGAAGGNVNKTRGSLTLNRVSISGGDASQGGGISNTGGSLTILRSTVSGNDAATGAGVYNTATLQVDTSTISGNGGAFGGGLHNGGSGAATLLGSTITNNSAAQNGGGIRVASGTVRASHTIIANNTAEVSGPDIGGTLTSDDYNLIGNTQGATVSGATTHNLTGVDPKLGPLADNGGPTDTHALLRGSPVIDAGAAGAQTSTDQRGEGFARPRGTATDIGALEATPNGVPTAQDDAYETPQDEILSVIAPGVLANDSDPDGDTLTAAKVDGPGSGTLILSPDGSFTYTPNAGFVGTDSFTYTANDGMDDGATVTVDISVKDVTSPTVLAPVKPTGKRVSPGANVVVKFSEAMERTTLDATSVTLTKKGANRAVGATLRFPSAESVVLDPKKPLRRGATYTARITTGPEDLAGNGLESDRVWSFRVRP